MAGNTLATPSGIQDGFGARAASVVSPNSRAQTGQGKLATALDVVTFSGTSITGQWIVPDQRVRVGGVPTISASSVGVATNSTPAGSGPMMVVQPDPRVRST